MRKTVIVIVVLALLCGCEVNQKTQMNTTQTSLAASFSVEREGGINTLAADWAFGVYNSPYVRCMTPAENGYYLILGSTLFYMDSSAMEPVPVCNKPNCLHHKETDPEKREACGAYMIYGQKSFVTYSEGKLYFIDWVETVDKTTQAPLQDALVRMDADGSNREILYRFDGTYNISRVLIHRGVLYMVMLSYDETAESKTELWAFSLTDTRKKPEVLLSFEDGGTGRGLQAITAYGTSLYFYQRFGGTITRTFCRYDIETRTLTEFDSPDEVYYPLEAHFVGENMYLRCKSIIPEGDPDLISSWPERLYRCDLNGRGMEPLLEGFGEYSSDGQYLYRVPSLQTFNEENHFLCIYNADGRELDSVDLYGLLPAKQIKAAGVIAPFGGQSFLWLRGGEGEQRVYLYWFDKSEIGSGQIEMHPLLHYSFNGGSTVIGADLVEFDTSEMQKTAQASSATTMSPPVTTVASATVATAAAATTTAVTAATTETTATTTAVVDMGPFANAAGYNTGSIKVEDLGIDLGGASLRFMCPADGREEGMTARAKVWEKVADYIGQTYNGTVELEGLGYSAYLEKLDTLLAAGDLPDVFYLSEMNNTSPSKLAKNGALLALDDYIGTCMPRTYAKLPETLWEAAKVDGHTYGMLLFPTYTAYNSLLYDKSLTDAAGVTLGDWVRISDNDETFYRMREWLDGSDPKRHDSAILEFGHFVGWEQEGNFDMIGMPVLGIQYPGFETVAGKAASTQVFNIFDTPEFLDYINRMHQLLMDRIVPYYADYALARENGWADSGKPVFEVKRDLLAVDTRLYDENYAVSMQDAAFFDDRASLALSQAVSARTVYPEAACRLIEILNNDPYVGTTLRLGEEGTHWDRTPDGHADQGLNSVVECWDGGAIGDVTISLMPTDEPLNRLELEQGRLAVAVSSGNLGFTVDSSGLEAELEAMDALYEEYLQFVPSHRYVYPGKLCDGSLEPGEAAAVLAEFVERLNAAGAERVRKEYQRQLDEWRVER